MPLHEPPAQITHQVKSHPGPFSARWAGIKPWEFRKNDRDYQVGQHLHEREYEPACNPGRQSGSLVGSYSGRNILSIITYVRQGGEFGIPDGYCIMTVETIAKAHWLPRIAEE